jgi:hypothetical protein
MFLNQSTKVKFTYLLKSKCTVFSLNVIKVFLKSYGKLTLFFKGFILPLLIVIAQLVREHYRKILIFFSQCPKNGLNLALLEPNVILAIASSIEPGQPEHMTSLTRLYYNCG